MVCGSIGCLPDVGSILCRGKGKEKCKYSGIAVSFSFRPGQKKMTAIAYQAMENKSTSSSKLRQELKTISTLYPALKELGAEKAENIFISRQRRLQGQWRRIR